MAPGRARDERKERQWRRRIDQWRVSGLSVRAFCAQHGLAQASFYAWRRVLRRRDAEKAAFVPVQLVAGAGPIQASALEVVLTDGRTVRVAPGFDAATLRQLLAVLDRANAPKMAKWASSPVSRTKRIVEKRPVFLHLWFAN